MPGSPPIHSQPPPSISAPPVAPATAERPPSTIEPAPAPQAATGLDTAPSLPIPPRSQHADSPPSGWCGETAIQEALLYFGVWAPQSFIHTAGRSAHPDLYSDEVPVALQQLGMLYDFYTPKPGGFRAYMSWAQRAVDAGYPVLSGVKILPTEHPDWGLDHFVLTVGHGEKGLLVNTTWGHRQWVSDDAIRGLSFRNVSYGIRIMGVRGRPDARAARLTVLSESATNVRLRVECPSVAAGTLHRLERRTLAQDRVPSWSSEVSGPVEIVVDANRPARFGCAAPAGSASVSSGGATF